MNIVLSPDSYKGSLTSIEAAQIMKKAIKEINSQTNVVMKPMADGGEGTLEALLTSTKGKRISISCSGALGNTITTSYAIINGNTAIIEGAKIAGLPQVPLSGRNPDYTTTYGIGEVIIDAMNNNCTSFIIGIGGSATNDGGLGMLLALGMKAYDKMGNSIGPYGKDLLLLSEVDFTKLDSRLKEVTLNVACDVDNPLCGEKGATYVYGPQKGATKEQLKQYNNALRYFGSRIENLQKKSITNVPGSGAAGGLGFAFLAINANLTSGAHLVAEEIQLENAVKEADLVITGEGQTDEQTIEYGKTADYVARLSQNYEVPALLLSGSLQGNQNRLREKFAGCFSILSSPLLLEESMNQAGELLYEQTKNVMHFAHCMNEVNVNDLT